MKKIIYLLPIFLILTILIYLTFFVKINSVKCSQNSTGCQYVNIESINNKLPLAVKDIKSDINQQLQENHYISSYSVRFNLPDKLIIEAMKRKPVFALGSGEDDSWYSIVAENGLVISVEETTQLEILQTSELKNAGDYINEKSFKAFKIYKHVKPYFNISEVKIEEDGLFIQTSEGFQAILPYDKDEEVLIGAILVVFNRLNSSVEKTIIDNRNNQELSELCVNGCLVDFRFQNPVIKAKI